MIFGFLLFTSCPKPTWSEISIQTQPYMLWASVFPTNTTPSDKSPSKEPLQIHLADTVYSSDSDQIPKVLSWLPSHDQLWDFKSISNSSSTQIQYAHWESDSVTIFARTPCDAEELTWHAPELHTTGTTDLPSQYTILQVSIPPYLEEVTLQMQCGTNSWTDTWNKNDSHAIPTVQWTTKEHSIRIMTSNADGHTLRLWNLNNTNEVFRKSDLLHSTFISHTLDGWEIEFPLTSSNKIQFQLSNNQNQVILTSAPITRDFQQLLTTSTVHSSNEPNTHLRLYSALLLGQGQPSDYVMTIQQHLDTIDKMFVADKENIWDWYNQPIWKSFHPNQEIIPHNTTQTKTPPFLRWGDTLKVSGRSFNGWYTEEEHHWIMGSPYDTNTSLVLSPEDGLLYDSHVESVMGAE